MNSHIAFMKSEQDALKRIESPKKVLDYAAAAMGPKSKAALPHQILVNFASDHHGCRFSCSYCGWRTHNSCQKFMTPNFIAFDEFIEGFAGYRIALSGGGDPLYHASLKSGNNENYNRLAEIAFRLNTEGFLCDVITREYKTACLPKIMTLFHQICLSVDGIHGNALDASKKICERGINRLRISAVMTRKKNIDEWVEELSFYGAYANAISVREDLFDSETRHIAIGVTKKLHRRGINVCFVPGNACLEGYFLMGTTVVRGQDIFNQETGEINSVQI